MDSRATVRADGESRGILVGNHEKVVAVTADNALHHDAVTPSDLLEVVMGSANEEGARVLTEADNLCVVVGVVQFDHCAIDTDK